MERLHLVDVLEHSTGCCVKNRLKGYNGGSSQRNGQKAIVANWKMENGLLDHGGGSIIDENQN